MTKVGDMMRGVRGDPRFVAMYAQVCIDAEREERDWIESLRTAGVKAAHPDDGWVDRTENTIRLQYPQCDDGARAGDLVALGRPQGRNAKPRHRIVRLTALHHTRFGRPVWAFEPANADAQRTA